MNSDASDLQKQSVLDHAASLGEPELIRLHSILSRYQHAVAIYATLLANLRNESLVSSDRFEELVAEAIGSLEKTNK